MKKQLFYTCMLFVSLFTASAQNTCATAVAITAGSYTAGAIDGTYQTGCWATAGDFAEWYSYTATADGFYRINTNLPENDGITYSDDTRFSVFTGTCAALTCYTSADDIDDTNYLTDFSFPVAQGQTYYIAFDDRWNADGFLFETSFTPATCFPIAGGLQVVGEPLPNEVTISWDPPAIGTPEGYEIEYGESGFTQGTGTMMDTTTEEAIFSGLDEATFYEFYIRTDCGEGDYSEWVGPIEFATPYAPTDLPYTFGFEADPLAGGWSSITSLPDGSGWQIIEEIPGVADAYSGTQLAYAGAGVGASDAWLFSRGINLAAGEEISISYYIARIALEGAGNVNNLEVTIGDDATVEAQTNSLATFDNYSNSDYTLQTNTFTAPIAGVYFIGFNYTAPAHADDNYGIITLDEVNVTSSLGLNENNILTFAVYPNPATEIINIINTDPINEVVITDINGRIVKSQLLENVTEAQIDISNLTSGVYIMNMSSQNSTSVRKIIKN